MTTRRRPTPSPVARQQPAAVGGGGGGDDDDDDEPPTVVFDIGHRGATKFGFRAAGVAPAGPLKRVFLVCVCRSITVSNGAFCVVLR